MDRLTENKIVLVIRATRLADLEARFATRMQAKFYVSRLGGDFSDYESEDASYHAAIAEARQVLSGLGRVQVVERSLLPNFVFGPEDVVVALGQDGLVANTLKYLHGQPLIGVNPDPTRWDGQLLPFTVRDLDKVARDVLRRRRPVMPVTMAQVTLNTGPTLFAVNDFFVGARTHVSARYRIEHGGQSENHSSSGVIVSTGLGSTGWLKSLLTGAAAIAQAAGTRDEPPRVDGNAGRKDVARSARKPETRDDGCYQRAVADLRWDSDLLFFTVREPFPTRTTAASIVFGRITGQHPLVVESQMSEHGVIFSDGIEQDFLEFNSGTRAVIGIADRKGSLVR